MKKKYSEKKILLGKSNYTLLFISISIITIGFILMSGGGSNNPDYFNDEIFNFRRIRLAPTIVLIGFGVAVLSIFINPDHKK